MKAGKMKKVLLLILCVIISITIIYTAIFHTLPFVIIGKKLYFTQARKVVVNPGIMEYDIDDPNELAEYKKKNMQKLSKFSNVRDLTVIGVGLDPVFLENKDKLENLYISDPKLKVEGISDKKAFANLKSLTLVTESFDMNLLDENDVIDGIDLTTDEIYNFDEIYDHSSLTELGLFMYSKKDTASLKLDQLYKLDQLRSLVFSLDNDEQKKYDLSFFAECDSIKRLVLNSEAESYDFLLDMDSLEELCVDEKFVSHGVFKALEEKGVKVKYME